MQLLKSNKNKDKYWIKMTEKDNLEFRLRNIKKDKVEGKEKSMSLWMKTKDYINS